MVVGYSPWGLKELDTNEQHIAQRREEGKDKRDHGVSGIYSLYDFKQFITSLSLNIFIKKLKRIRSKF